MNPGWTIHPRGDRGGAHPCTGWFIGALRLDDDEEEDEDVEDEDEFEDDDGDEEDEDDDEDVPETWQVRAHGRPEPLMGSRLTSGVELPRLAASFQLS